MTPKDLLHVKANKEQEYAKIPLVMQGKGIQLKKRKEELEYELDLLDKTIAKRGTSSDPSAAINTTSRHRSSNRLPANGVR